jgi:hypothetical protein
MNARDERGPDNARPRLRFELVFSSRSLHPGPELGAKAQGNGDDRDRTGNLRVANAALSQLSYVPAMNFGSGIYDFGGRRSGECRPVCRFKSEIRNLKSEIPRVGALGFEPRTSALSGLRSNQLSYAPGDGRSPLRNRSIANSPAVFPSRAAVCEYFGVFPPDCPVTLAADQRLSA